MLEIWANLLLPKALKSCPKSNKSPNLAALERESVCEREGKSVRERMRQKESPYRKSFQNDSDFNSIDFLQKSVFAAINV